MQINVLIQNFFERNGTFAGIKSSSIGESLEGCATTYGGDLNRLLYQSLGFPSEEVFLGMTDNARIKVDSEWTRLCKTEVKSWDTADVVTAAIILLKSNRDVSEMSSLAKNFVYNTIALNTWLSQLEVTVPSSVFGIHPISSIMESIRVASMKQSELNKVTKEIIDVIKDYSVSVNNASVSIAGTDVKLLQVPGVKPKIMLAHAVKMAAVTSIANTVTLPKNRMEVVFLSDFNPESYKELLALCNAMGCTYRDVMSVLGFNVPDQLTAFDYTGSDMRMLGDSVFRHDNTGLTKLPFQNFMLKVNGAEFDLEDMVWQVQCKEVSSFS